jgi:dienelactone hydrolase
MRLVALIAGFFATACCSSLPRLSQKQQPFTLHAPQFERVEETSLEWHDAARDRDVPVKIYEPAGANGKLPVVIVSHGIGEDRDTYAFLGRALARHGYMSVHVTHAGTDKAMLRRGYLHLYRAVKDPKNWIARTLDVTFVLDRLATRADADLDRVAVVGHSAGAFTAFSVAGIRTTDGRTLRDPRVKGIVAISIPRLDGIVADWNVPIPVLNVTGTCDTSLIYRTFPRHRRIPFESSRGQSLVTIEGVNHNTTSAKSDPHQELIAQLVVAWLAKRDWFEQKGIAQVLGTRVAVEAQ